PEPCRVARLLAARLDSTIVLVPGRCGAALLAGLAMCPRAVGRTDDIARVLASARLGRAGYLSAVAGPAADLLHLRRHTDPDWPGLRLFVSARPGRRARAVECAGIDPGRLLARFCSVSAAGGRLRLGQGGRRTELAAPC